MSLHARITKLESHRLLTAGQQLRTMSDEKLEALLKSSLSRLSDEAFESICHTHPEQRSRYEEYRNSP